MYITRKTNDLPKRIKSIEKRVKEVPEHYNFKYELEEKLRIAKAFLLPDLLHIADERITSLEDLIDSLERARLI